MATALGFLLAGTAIGYTANQALRSLWYNKEVLSDSEDEGEDAQDEDVDESAHLPEECKMVRAKAVSVLMAQVLGVRTDLKMDKGKIAAQCGYVDRLAHERHATLAAYKLAKRITPQVR